MLQMLLEKRDVFHYKTVMYKIVELVFQQTVMYVKPACQAIYLYLDNALNVNFLAFSALSLLIMSILQSLSQKFNLFSQL